MDYIYLAYISLQLKVYGLYLLGIHKFAVESVWIIIFTWHVQKYAVENVWTCVQPGIVHFRETLF